jgi:hypothetical protein
VDVRNLKLARRDFLKMSSASLVTPALVGSTVAWKPLPFPSFDLSSAPSPASTPRVMVGYWDGRLASDFVDARQLDAADRSLARGVQVRVDGCCGSDAISTWSAFRSVSLGFDLRPFHHGDLRVWQYQAHPVASSSPLASFDIPVDSRTGLAGWIEYRDLNARSAPVRVPVRFGLNDARGAIRLRSGYYVIALREPGTLVGVDWPSLSLRVTDGGNALSLQDRLGRDFSHPHIVVEMYPS